MLFYDPAADFFTSVAISRSSHTATLLPDGRVLIVGGKSAAELFDPATHTFTATANVPVKRKSHAAILLNEGTAASEGVMSVDWRYPRGRSSTRPIAPLRNARVLCELPARIMP